MVERWKGISLQPVHHWLRIENTLARVRVLGQGSTRFLLLEMEGSLSPSVSLGAGVWKGCWGATLTSLPHSLT